MSEMKMENSRVPAEKIFNPDLKEAIVTMQEDNSKENVDKMITEVVKAKFILPAKVVPTTQAGTEKSSAMKSLTAFAPPFASRAFIWTARPTLTANWQGSGSTAIPHSSLTLLTCSVTARTR